MMVKENWEAYKKWLKRSLDLTKMVKQDSTTTTEENITLNEKIKTFEFCLKKRWKIWKKLGNKIVMRK